MRIQPAVIFHPMDSRQDCAERGVMKVDFSWEFSDEELAAIANHLGETEMNADHVKDFLQITVRDALERAIVECKAMVNDPSSNTGP